MLDQSTFQMQMTISQMFYPNRQIFFEKIAASLSPESVIRIRPAPAPNEGAFTKKLNEPRNRRTLRDDVRSLIQISQPLARKIDIVWGKFVPGLKKADCDIRSGVAQNLCDRSDNDEARAVI